MYPWPGGPAILSDRHVAMNPARPKEKVFGIPCRLPSPAHQALEKFRFLFAPLTTHPIHLAILLANDMKKM